MKEELSNEDYKQISEILKNTTSNVYYLSLSRFRHDWTDEDWEKLKSICGVFRCELCSRWQSVSIESERGLCLECVDAFEED